MRVTFIVCLLSLFIAAGCGKTEPRTGKVEGEPDRSDWVKVTVAGVGFSPPTGGYVIHIQAAGTKDETTIVPVYVGEREATVLHRKLARQSFVRPLTHDLALSLLAEAGAEISYVVVDNLRDGVFLARVYITDQNGNLKAVDSRASDAIILGVSSGIPVHFARPVIEEAGVAISKEEDEPYI